MFYENGDLVKWGGHGDRIDVNKGQLIEVINVDGQQICDFFAFNTHDLTEQLSPGYCREQLRSVVLKVGDVLVTQYYNPMLEIVEDTVGLHDMTFPPCDPARYLLGFAAAFGRSDLAVERTTRVKEITDGRPQWSRQSS